MASTTPEKVCADERQRGIALRQFECNYSSFEGTDSTSTVTMRLAWCVLIASAVGADALKRRAKGAAPPPTASERFVSSLKAGDLRTAFKVSPRAYADWWTALAQEAPQHVAVESVLLALIAWLLLGMKKSDSREEPLSQLSKREIEELVEEWRLGRRARRRRRAGKIQSFDGATVTVSGSRRS